MKLRRLMEIRDWPDFAVEAALRLGWSLPSVGSSHTMLPASLRERVSVRWPRAYQWRFMYIGGDQLRDMLQRRVDVVRADLPQPYRGTIVSQFVVDGRPHQVAFNVSDYPDFVEEECTRDSLLTFKFQFRDDGYPHPTIVPGGYLPASRKLYPFLKYLRWAKSHREPRFDVYGRFSMSFARDIRAEVLRDLANAGSFTFWGGDRVVSYSRYLREVARARVCIDLPGTGPLCMRFVEYLAVGACVVARRHGVRLPGEVGDGTHLVYWSGGPDEAVRACQELLEDEARRQVMEKSAREFFDRYLHRDQLSAYYISMVLAAAGAS